ncbi:MAG TPA: carboxypeptidase regulatory-like domain-containing protein [Candidatus Angelobacter sp.]
MKMFVRNRLSSIVLVLAGFTILCGLATAQVLKGSISGTVVDPQGAVVSGAQVKATQTDTGSVLTTTTENSGLFRFNLVPVGTYKVEVTAKGFKTAQESVLVSAGADQGLGSIPLAVGESTSTVEVSAGEASLIEPSQAQVTNTFTGEALHTFSGAQENEGLDNLALFVPGVVSSRDNNFANVNGGAGFAVNGVRGRNNDQQIDGQNNNDNSVTGPALQVADPEFVQQYVLVSNQFGPEYGRNAGSVVNIITKTGGNAWHGSVFGDENNSILNAETNFQKNAALNSTPLTHLPRANDELGGFTIGGPVVKNKMFLFGGFDEEIVSSSTQYLSPGLTPTPAGLVTLGGCFLGSSNLAALQKFGPFGISSGNPQVNGQVQTGIVPSCPTAQFAGLSRLLSTPSHLFNWIGRSDIQLGNDTITGRYIFNRNNTFNADPGGGAAATGYPFNIPALAQASLLSWTHNFSTHMVNESRVAFGRVNVEFGGNQIGNTIPVVGNLSNALTSVAFGNPTLGGFGVPPGLPQGRIVDTWQLQDNWNFIVGKHTLKAGVNWTYQRSPSTFLPLLNGQFVFPDWTTFFNNTPSRAVIEEGPPLLDFREYDTFAYVGDDWKLGQNFTLNAGLTWSYYGQPANLLHNLDVANETGPNPFFNPALGLAVTTQPQLSSQKNLFGPSIGFAYSPQWGGFLTGHGKTVIRGGYRLLYDPPFYNIYSNVFGTAPQVFSQVIQPAPPGVPPAFTGPAVRAALAPLLPLGKLDPREQTRQIINPGFGADTVHNWSFGVQRELTRNSAFEVRYAGTHGTNLFQTVNANPFIGALAADFPNLIPAGVTPCPAASAVVPRAIGRVNCNEGVTIAVNNSGFSDYHALQTEFRANNLFKQLTLRAAYTFSKTTDNTSEIFSTAGTVGLGGGNTVTIAQNPLNTQSAEHALSGLDIPHQFTILFSEQLPFFKAQHGLLGHLLGGWGVAGDYVLASGQNYTPATINFATCSNPNNPACVPGGAGDYFDQRGFNASDNGIEPARPFFGSLSAPASAVGVFAGDLCNSFGAGCALAPTQLVSLNAFNVASQSATFNPATFVPTAVTTSQVRFIVNAFTAQQVFGTPFGNVPRNALRDAMSNVANASVFKQIKLGERANFTFHATMLNAFNHPNFQTVDPFVSDAGLTGAGLGFAQPGNTNDNLPGFSVARRIVFGGKLTF